MVTLEALLFIVLVLILVCLLILFRSSIIKLVKTKVIEIEKKYKGMSGKEKLNAALLEVNKALRLLKYFVPNAKIIKYIEMIVREFNKFSKL